MAERIVSASHIVLRVHVAVGGWAELLDEPAALRDLRLAAGIHRRREQLVVLLEDDERLLRQAVERPDIPLTCDVGAVYVPTPRNIYVSLGGFARRFLTVTDRFFGSWRRFPESWRQDGENGEKMGKKRGKMGEKWPKKSGGKLT